jgi:hypothetical protein
MLNGSIIELVSKSQLDDDITDKTNKSSIFNFDILNKKNKYSKLDFNYYPQGKGNWNTTSRFQIKHDGDLLYGLYLKIKLPKLSVKYLNVTPTPNEYNTPVTPYRIKYVDYIGNAMIKKISLYINDMLIDELHGTYMQIYTDLYLSDSNRKSMIGLDDNLNKPKFKMDPEYIYIPLKFFFCDTTKPLPLIALQYSDIYIDVQLRDFNECVTVLEEYNSILFHSNAIHQQFSIEEISLQANFYLVEQEERKKLATREYEILITQSQVRTVQFNGFTTLDISFNHVVKDIIFFIQPNSNRKNGEFFNFTAKPKYLPQSLINQIISNPNVDFKNVSLLYSLEPTRHLLTQARLLFNGIERINWKDPKYFYLMQNHENYRNTLYSYIYLYSFNINPVQNNNWSGCNFSRLENPQLQLNIKPDPFILNLNPLITNPTDDLYHLVCYATNFNIFIIKNGVAGLKYNN